MPSGFRIPRRRLVATGLIASLTLAGCAGAPADAGSASNSVTASLAAVKRDLAADSPPLDRCASIAEDAPSLMVDGRRLRYRRHEIALRAGKLVRVQVVAQDPEKFDPLMECRAADAAPNEVVRCEDVPDLGNGVRLDLLPERDGIWYVHVGDEQNRTGDYRLQIVPVKERRIFSASGTVSRALTGTEKPVTLFCQTQAGRRLRVRIAAKDFPPYALVGEPGVATPRRVPESGELVFTSARTGQIVIQVSSLSLASGRFDAEVTELWE